MDSVLPEATARESGKNDLINLFLTKDTAVDKTSLCYRFRRNGLTPLSAFRSTTFIGLSDLKSLRASS